MLNKKLGKRLSEQMQRWEEYPEESPAEIDSLSLKELIDDIKNSTDIEGVGPNCTKEDFIKKVTENYNNRTKKLKK